MGTSAGTKSARPLTAASVAPSTLGDTPHAHRAPADGHERSRVGDCPRFRFDRFPARSDTSFLDCIRWGRIERVANAQVRFYCEHSISSAHVTDIANDQSGLTDDAAFGAR